MWPFTTTKKSIVNSRFLKTGLKIIDLLFPLPIAGDVLLTGDSRSGIKTLGIEIANRLMNSPEKSFELVVYLDSWISEVEAEAHELDAALPNCKNIRVVESITAEELDGHLQQIKSKQNIAVCLMSDRSSLVHHFREAIRIRRNSSQPKQSLLSMVIGEKIDDVTFDAVLYSSRMIASQGIYPALDINKSFTKSLIGNSSDADLEKVAHDVRQALVLITSQLEEKSLSDASWAFNTDHDKRAIGQVLRFISQPFFTAEKYTGLSAAFVPSKTAMRDFQNILAQKYLDLPPQNFLYKNELEPQSRQ